MENRTEAEAPLREADETLKAFAQVLGAKVERNPHGWPNRRVVWKGSDRVTRAIQISLDDESKRTFQLSYLAWRDKGGNRYGKRVVIGRGVPRFRLRENLARFLDEGKQTLESWSERDLEFWSNLP